MIPISSLELSARSIWAVRLSIRYASSSSAGKDRVSLAAWTTARARRSWVSRSAWMACPRCVDDPRMSASP